MLPERQVSVALVGIGAALVIPEYVALSHHPGVTPGASLAIGGVLGALGVFLGGLLAWGHPARSARVLVLGLWILLGLAFSGVVFAGALHSATWGRRVVFGLVGLLPILGLIVVLVWGEKG